jgi:hypothetical protein
MCGAEPGAGFLGLGHGERRAAGAQAQRPGKGLANASAGACGEL